MTENCLRRALRQPVRCVLALSLAIAAAGPALGAQVTRDDFGAGAVAFGFDDAGVPTLSDGFMTVSNADVTDAEGASIGVEWGDFAGANAIGGDIRFDFAEPVSAFGIDFIANDTCSFRWYTAYPNLCAGEIVDSIDFSVYGALGQLIQRVTFGLSLGIDFLDTVGPDAGPADLPHGFAGLSTADPIIAYATFSSDLPAGLVPLRVDNAIYEPGPIGVSNGQDTINTAAAPVPGTAVLLSFALAGLGFARRRQPQR